MKNKIGILLLASLSAYAGEKHVASGRAKAFKGPEGEIITMVPVDDNASMVVLAQNTYGVLDGKSVLYENRAFNTDNATLTCSDTVPSGDASKPTMRVFLNRHDGIWNYMDLLNTDHGQVLMMKLTYSEELSKKINVQAILKKVDSCLTHGAKVDSK